MSASGSRATILDIPNEILRKIILHLNARERIPLGVSCQRFNSLVFEDEELLRDLDFSEEAYRTSEKDIQQYFNNENTYKFSRRLNIRNIGCIQPGYVFENSIGKAINLVDVNIHGATFEDIWQLGVFLNPLLHLQRLSFDWPNIKETDPVLCYKILQNPFSRLVYLSVATLYLYDKMNVFVSCLLVCQKLKELRVVANSSQQVRNGSWSGEPRELPNLEIFEYCGPEPMTIKERFLPMLPVSRKWMDFQLDINNLESSGFYLGSSDICKELVASGFLQRLSNLTRENHLTLGWVLLPEILIQEVLQITHKHVPEELCCLSTYTQGKRCFLKIDEAKQLLKNPRYPISYLSINHRIELGCDVHLVASAFPNLTELVLVGITRSLESMPGDWHFQRRLRNRASADLEVREESLNMDTSFKMLVHNTPNLRHFTMDGRGRLPDREALYLISNWKNLRTLRLLHASKQDANYLINIGKQCKHLEKLELMNLELHSSSYTKMMLEMLKYCKKLTDFSIEDRQMNTTEVFTSLAKKKQLKKICMKSSSHTFQMIGDLISFMETLFNRCPILTVFQCELIEGFPCRRSGIYTTELQDLEKAIKGLQSKLSRPNLQIQVAFENKKAGAILKDVPHPQPFPHIKWTEN